jgi:hypothetical protein
MADLRSDFSAIHRVRDVDKELSAEQFYEMAWRMSAYKGVMRMRIENYHYGQQAGDSTSAAVAPASTSGEVTLDQLSLAMPDLIERG